MKNSSNLLDKQYSSSSNHDIDDESEVKSNREQDNNLNKRGIQQTMKINNGGSKKPQNKNKDAQFQDDKRSAEYYNLNSAHGVDTSQYINYNHGNNQGDKTDISQYNLNITQISNNQMLPDMIFDDEPPRFKEGQQNSMLDSQSLNIKKIKNGKDSSLHQTKKLSNAADIIQQPQNAGNGEYLSHNMMELKISLEIDDEKKFEDILKRELYDSEETLMYLYAAISCFNSEKVFEWLLRKNNYFKVNKELNQLFSTTHVFLQLSGFSSSIERRKFDCIVLKIAIERDFFFMSDILLDRSLMTKEMIQILLSENQKKLLVQQLSKPKRPIYLDVDQYNLNNKHKKYTEDVERDLHFNDILYAALDKNESSKSVIDLIKFMKNEIQAKFFEEPEKEFNLKDLFRIFVQRRKIKLLRFLFSLHNEFDFNPQLFIESLELESFDIGALLYKEFFRRLKDSKKENEYIITILISSLNKNNGQLDFKSYLLRSYLDQFILRHAKQFLDTLDSKILQENKFNILVMNLNVVKTSCLLIEILEMVADKFERLKVRCKTLRSKIEQISKKYMVGIETEQEMRYLLLEKDFENRDSLELITRYNITPLLESQFADNVVREIWRSPYATNNSLFSASTNHKLTFYYWNCIKDDELTSRFYQPKDLKEFEVHPLQFTVWRFSGKSRIIVEFFATGILAAIIHILINDLLQEAPKIYDTLTDFFVLENNAKSISNKTSPEYIRAEAIYRQSYTIMSSAADIFFQKVLIVSYVSILPLLFAFQHIFNIVYASINKRMINPYAFLNILDLVIFGIFFANIIITYVKNLNGTWMDYPLIGDETRAVVYCRNYYGGLVSEDALWICCIVILWIRVFYLLRYNEFMGKFVAIIERLIYDVFLFFCFYLLQLIFFALIAELCFRRLTDYNTSYKAFKTLFYASMGQFSFDEMQQADYGEYFGITFMIIFLVCNIGIIMHLFIAVITVLYDSFSEQQNIYQMLETLKLRSYTQADKEYSSLVSLPPPLNVLHVIFAPFLLTAKNPEKINEFVLCIAYIPVMFGVTLLFILYNILLIPFTYIKLFFHKLVMIYVYSKSYRVSRADKFITWVFFVFFGPFTLCLNAFTDIWYFLKHLWLRDMPKTKHKTSDKQISKETLGKLNGYFKGKQEKILPYKKVAIDIRDQLHIIESVSNIIRPNGIQNLVRYNSLMKSNQEFEFRQSQIYSANQMMDQKQLDSMFYQINEYSIIKQVMERNSDFIRVFESNQRVKTVDCKIMHTMIADLYRYKTVLKVEDEDYIFVRRAVNVKSMANQQSNNKKKKDLDSDKSDQQHLSVQIDSEGTKESKKRQKALFKKLLFLNTKRMLEILNFKTGETESKKLLHAMDKQDGGAQSKNNVLKNMRQNIYGVDNGIGGIDPNDLDDLEEKVFQMGSINPQLNTSLMQMRSEIQNLIHHLSNVQNQQQENTEKERTYQTKINGLLVELQNVKQDKDNAQSRTQHVIEDYFYERRKSSKRQQQQQQQQQQRQQVVDDEPFQKANQQQNYQEEDELMKVQVNNTNKNNNMQSMDSNNFNSRLRQGHQKVGQPSPQKNKRQETESDIPDVDDDD